MTDIQANLPEAARGDPSITSFNLHQRDVSSVTMFVPPSPLLQAITPATNVSAIPTTTTTTTSSSSAMVQQQHQPYKQLSSSESSNLPTNPTQASALPGLGLLSLPGTELFGVDCNGLEEAGVQMGIKVRGLDLMRYGRLEENGVYVCIECERVQINKTFKTSYSFQRHAYLYHEGLPKRFPCPICHKEFSRPDKRKSHLKEKHGLLHHEPFDHLLDFAS